MIASCKTPGCILPILHNSEYCGDCKEALGCDEAYYPEQAVKGETGADTIKARESVYGPFEVHAKAEQAMLKVMRAQPGWENFNDVQKSAAEMIVHKLARCLNNSADYADNWHDIAGYATLAENDIKNRQNM